MTVCYWPVNDNETLEFTVYDTSASRNDVAGLYVFAYPTDETHWFPVYVGQTDSFKDRIPSHEKWDAAVRYGATHIHALAVSLAANRDKWEKMLIEHLQSPLNLQRR